METLRIPPWGVQLLLTPKLPAEDAAFCSAQMVPWRSRKRVRSFCVPRGSYGDAGGDLSSRASNGAQDKEKEDVRLLGTQRDSSGSIVGFQLIPYAGAKLECSSMFVLYNCGNGSVFVNSPCCVN